MKNVSNNTFGQMDQKTLKKIADMGVDVDMGNMYNHIKKATIVEGKEAYYIKEMETERAIPSAASSQMYRDIGISTPEIKLLHEDIFSKNKGISRIIQPDVTIQPYVETILAADDKEITKIPKGVFTKNKWQIFYDLDLQLKFLQIMTPECLESLKNIYLIDELRTDNDRHAKNYFFYKSIGSKLYEGVIVIDLDHMQVLQYINMGKDDFDAFRYTPYHSATMQQTEDYRSYMQRLYDLRELIDDGVLSAYNIETMVKALRYDFPGKIDLLCRKQKLSPKLRKQIIYPLAKLWEFNQNTLGPDLNL